MCLMLGETKFKHHPSAALFQLMAASHTTLFSTGHSLFALTDYDRMILGTAVLSPHWQIFM